MNDIDTLPRQSAEQKRRVGIGVGVGVGGSGALAAVLAGVCTRRRKRRKQREREEEENRKKMSQGTDGQEKVAECDGKGIAAELEAALTFWGGELDAAEKCKELESESIRGELE